MRALAKLDIFLKVVRIMLTYGEKLRMHGHFIQRKQAGKTFFGFFHMHFI